MKGRPLIEAIIARKNPNGSNGFWVGHPADETKALYYPHMGIREDTLDSLAQHNRDASVILTNSGGRSEVDFAFKAGSDMIWFSPETNMSSWVHPEGKPMWDCFQNKRNSLGEAGIFAEVSSIADIDAFDWPNPDYLDFTPALEETRYAYEQGLAVFGGMWCPFFHTVSDFFGMENYFVKMHTDPALVHAVTEHVVDFYLETNARCLTVMGQYLSAGFVGNDLGSQRGPLISPAHFEEFIAPYLARIIADIQKAGLPVALHSCGAVSSLIPRFIELGVGILHPLQALANGMDAASLAREYRDDLIFLGGVDTQHLLPFGSAEQVREKTLQLRDVFGDGYIVSPSHEALLPNVPLDNVLAMSAAAKATCNT